MPAQLIYFADPMCSWCWGFSPVIEAVRTRFVGRVPVHLILGGLRPGTTHALTDDAKATIREHWEHVHQASGQPFDFAFFDRDGFVYDTEPPCRALVVLRTLDPDAVFPFLKTVHHAFYAENRDVTDRAVLADLAEAAGVDRAAFLAAFDADDTVRETQRDFATTYRAGINGFPTLIAGSVETGYGLITHGYQPWDRIGPAIDAWLAKTDQGADPADRQPA